MSGKLVCIAKFTNAGEAHIARSVLESEEITAYVEAENANTVLAYYGSAIGGVRLTVFAEQAEKAKAILAAHDEADLQSVDVGEPVECDEDGTLLPKQQRKPSKHEDDELTPRQREIEGHIRRAWFASIIGLTICPAIFHLYSLYILLSKDLIWPNPHTWRDWRVKGALAVDLLALLCTAVMVLLSILGDVYFPFEHFFTPLPALDGL